MGDSFVFYRSFAEVIEMIPDPEEQILMLKALIDYGLNGIEPNLEYPLNAMFKQMTSSIAGAQKRYNASVENGKKGGNPNFKKGKSNPYYKGKKITQDNLNITQDNPEITPDNLNNNDNDNVNVNDNYQLSYKEKLSKAPTVCAPLKAAQPSVRVTWETVQDEDGKVRFIKHEHAGGDTT